MLPGMDQPMFNALFNSVRRRAAAIRNWCLLGLALVLGLSGCGYSHQELFPKDIRTVAVPIFDNRTFYRGVEFDLTEAIIKQIELRTPYKTVPQERSDTVLKGTITALEQRTLSSTREGGMPEEIEIKLVVDFEWRNARSGQVLRERKGFATVARYLPPRVIGETYNNAQHQAVQRMADDIVSALREDW